MKSMRAQSGPDVAATRHVPLTELALFLDFDGTLVEIQPDPETLAVPPALPALLARLTQDLSGAVTILSGRTLTTLDRFLGDGAWSLAGVHGLERRLEGRAQHEVEPGLASALDRVRAKLTAAGPAPFDIEDKGRSIALHYRRHPDAGPAALAFARDAVAAEPSLLRLQTGKMVAEIAPSRASKGAALHWFMQRPPNLGRVPVMIGDDDTDEAASRRRMRSAGRDQGRPRVEPCNVTPWLAGGGPRAAAVGSRERRAGDPMNHGWKPSLDLAVIGNCAIAALVDRQARIVWSCFPRLDGDPVFHALVDHERAGGSFAISLVDQVACEQSYVENTAVLSSRLRDRHGNEVEILDFCPRFTRFERSFRPPQIIRRVAPLKGRPRGCASRSGPASAMAHASPTSRAAPITRASSAQARA